MVFVEAFFGITPKTFYTVNGVMSFAKSFGMFDSAMLSVLLQILVGFGVICVKHRSFFCFFFDVLKQSLSTYVFNYSGVNSSVSLENSKYRLLARSTSATITFALSSEIGLICFYLAIQFSKLMFRITQYR